MRILIVEDEAAPGEVIKRIAEKYGWTAEWVTNAQDGLSLARERHTDEPDVLYYDCMLLDLGLPAKSVSAEVVSGIDLIIKLRRESNQLPIIVVSGRESNADIENALDAGADDYVKKSELRPSYTGTFRARIQAVTRRSVGHASSAVVNGLLEINRQSKSAAFAGRQLRFDPQETKLLFVLVENAGRVLSHTRLIEECGIGEYGENPKNNLEKRVGWLRKGFQLALAEHWIEEGKVDGLKGLEEKLGLIVDKQERLEIALLGTVSDESSTDSHKSKEQMKTKLANYRPEFVRLLSTVVNEEVLVTRTGVGYQFRGFQVNAD